MDLEVRRTEDATVVKLNGNWTIERATELRPALLEALGSSGHILIDLEELTDADLSVVQLLCSAHRASVRLGKRLDLSERKAEPLKRIVRDAGLAGAPGCHEEPHKGCLWTGDWTS